MQRIDKARAIQLIQQSKGKFMTLAGKKNNGEMRIYKSSKFNDIHYLKYINIWERASSGFRNVSIANLEYLKTAGQEYKVA